MFNLVGKRYLFLIISLLVIIPGAISLIFRGLNVGIDFAGGTNVEFRPEKTISVTDIRNLVKPFNLQDLQVVTGQNTQVPGNQTIWVRLNTRIDKNVQAAIQNDLQAKYGNQLKVSFDDLPLIPSTGGKVTTVTVVTATNFPAGVTPQISDLRSLLSKLPDTSDPSKGPPTSTPTPTTSPTATPTTTGTPRATSTPKATTTGTPAVKPAGTPTTTPGTPAVAVTPTATTVSNPPNIPVKVVEIRQGTTTQTFSLLTRSFVDEPTRLKLEATFVNNGTYVQLLDNATVSGSVAAETTRNAVLAVAAASVFILLYIWFAFRKVQRPWRYGACAIIALLHDVLVVLGVFSILGWLFNVQIDALFITALLTICGFSVHDTIVVFDRIRENMQRRTSETFEQVVNASLVQTMARSLNTSLTVLFTLSALTLFGGTTIRTFTLALLIGIFSGTYSSIFNASMLLVIWERGELGFGRLRRMREPEKREREARELARTRG